MSKKIPKKEEWLWKNKKALRDVLEGIEQARKRKFAKDPRGKMKNKKQPSAIEHVKRNFKEAQKQTNFKPKKPDKKK